MPPNKHDSRSLDDLGFDPLNVRDWFAREVYAAYTFVTVPEEIVQKWSDALCVPIRRCYICDESLKEWAAKRGVAPSQVLSALLPGPGSVMSGDFAEILVFVYHASRPELSGAFAPRKWRLKSDRTKAAPYSDVVYFLLPSWPVASEADELVCSEVKAKATASSASPIRAAIEDSAKDRVSRLARTLVWLRERALTTDLDALTLPILNRFLDAADQPPFLRRFNAIAVISDDLVSDELDDIPSERSSEFDLTIIAVPQLRDAYSRVYDAARLSADALEVE
jgi:hypothetical protein